MALLFIFRFLQDGSDCTLQQGGTMSVLPNDWRGTSSSGNPAGVLPVGDGHMMVVRLWERRQVGVGPPAARTVHTAHSVLLPTSKELSGR